MSTNITPGNLGNVIASIKARKAIYSAYIVAGVAIGATQVGFASVEGAGQPTWLTVALAVYAFLSVPLGSLAVANTPSSLPEAIATVEEAEDKSDGVDGRGNSLQ